MIKHLMLVLLLLPSCEEIKRQNRREKEVRKLLPMFVDTQGRCWLLKNATGKTHGSLLVRLEDCKDGKLNETNLE